MVRPNVLEAMDTAQLERELDRVGAMESKVEEYRLLVERVYFEKSSGAK
jgi:hypothetical protein